MVKPRNTFLTCILQQYQPTPLNHYFRCYDRLNTTKRFAILQKQPYGNKMLPSIEENIYFDLKLFKLW